MSESSPTLLDLSDIPEPIRKAAIALEVFFKFNGIEEWALMGIQSRNDCREQLQAERAARVKSIEQERDALRVEYESRALWIAEMNKILGYDNTDGFHSEPPRHELARRLVAELDRLREWFQNSYSVERCEFSPTDWKTLRDRALAERDALKLKLEVAIELLKIAVCPNCDGSGATMRGDYRTVSKEMALDAGDPSMEGAPFSEPEVEQCQWCDERKKAIAQLNGEFQDRPNAVPVAPVVHGNDTREIPVQIK